MTPWIKLGAAVAGLASTVVGVRNEDYRASAGDIAAMQAWSTTMVATSALEKAHYNRKPDSMCQGAEKQPPKCQGRAKSASEVDAYVHAVLAKGERTESPTSILMAGGPGSGKSSTLRTKALSGFVTIDIDDILMTLFPTPDKDAVYDCIGEAVPILIKIKTMAMSGRLNIIFDGTGRNLDLQKRTAEELHKAGYTVEVLGTYLPWAEAEERMSARAIKENRAIDTSYAKQTYADIAKNFPLFGSDTAHFDEVEIFNNNVAPGAAPVLLFERKGSAITCTSALTALTDPSVADLKALCP